MENYMKSLPYGDRNIVDERIKKERPLNRGAIRKHEKTQ